jgi:hypothetical protein
MMEKWKIYRHSVPRRNPKYSERTTFDIHPEEAALSSGLNLFVPKTLMAYPSLDRADRPRLQRAIGSLFPPTNIIMQLVLSLIILIAASDSLQTTISKQFGDKGKQSESSLKVRKPRYIPPPAKEAYSMTAWDLIKYKPTKPSKKFANLFANHPQIKPLHPKKYEDKPQDLAEEFEKLRPVDSIGKVSHKPFTSAIKTYLKDKKASLHLQSIVSGYNTRMRTSQVAKRVYQRKVQNQDPETAARKRVSDNARRAERRKRLESSPSLSELLAKYNLPEVLPAAELAKHSTLLLQDIPADTGSMILRQYMRQHGYSKSDFDYVQACRTRHCTTESYARRSAKKVPESVSNTLPASSQLESSSRDILQGGDQFDDSQWWESL